MMVYGLNFILEDFFLLRTLHVCVQSMIRIGGQSSPPEILRPATALLVDGRNGGGSSRS